MQQYPRKRTRSSLLACLVGAVSLLGSLPAVPGDGKTPIWQPTVIDKDGSYILTRDITAPGIILDILPSAQHVDIDLNGKRLTRTDAGVVIRAVAPPSTVKRTLEVYRGVLWNEVMPAAGQTTVSTSNWQGASLRDFKTNGQINVDEVEIAEFHYVTSAGTAITGTASDHVTGSLSDLTIVDSDGVGLDVVYGSALRVEDVVIENPASHGVRANNCDACQFANVSVQDAGGNAVRVEETRASRWDGISSIRSQGSSIFVDVVGQGNSFTDVTASFAQNGNTGFENNGSQTSLIRGRFHGCSGGGIVNNGSEFSMWQSNALGNAPPNFQDNGFMTNVDGWTFY